MALTEALHSIRGGKGFPPSIHENAAIYTANGGRKSFRAVIEDRA